MVVGDTGLMVVFSYLYVQLCALVFAQVWPALMAGLLFAVHPIHTEAVSTYGDNYHCN